MDKLLAEFESLVWLPPWESTHFAFEVELEREVGKEHQLFGQKAVSLARLLKDNHEKLAQQQHPMAIACNRPVRNELPI